MLVEEVGTEVKRVVEKIAQEEAEEEVQNGLEENAGKGNEEVVITPNKVVLRTRPSKKVGDVRRQKKDAAKKLIRREKPKKRRCRLFPTFNQAH